MLKILWASNDFKLSLLLSVFNAGLVFFIWYSLRMNFMLGLGLVCILSPINLGLKLIIEHQLKMRGTSRPISALLVGAWDFLSTLGSLVLIGLLAFPEILQEANIVALFLGLGIVADLTSFQMKWKELKRQASSKSTTPPSPLAP